MVAAPVVVQGAYAMRPYMHSANSTAPVGADYISARTRRVVLDAPVVVRGAYGMAWRVSVGAQKSPGRVARGMMCGRD